MALPIPETLNEITADWLTLALRQRRVISEETTVLGRTFEVFGVGEGFAGELARIQLTYEGGSGPATVIAKIPTSVTDNRNGSEMLGVYERELRLYEQILPDIDVSAPLRGGWRLSVRRSEGTLRGRSGVAAGPHGLSRPA